MTTIHYVIYKDDDFSIVATKAVCGYGVNRNRVFPTDYCVTLWYFLHELCVNNRCQECYDAIDPLELLNVIEL